MTWGVGSSSGTNSCFQIQPLFRRRCGGVDPGADGRSGAVGSLAAALGMAEKSANVATMLSVSIRARAPMTTEVSLF